MQNVYSKLLPIFRFFSYLLLSHLCLKYFLLELHFPLLWSNISLYCESVFPKLINLVTYQCQSLTYRNFSLIGSRWLSQYQLACPLRIAKAGKKEIKGIFLV